jgi:Fur family transcriptional regulator, ferric uptake regulator
MSDPVRAHAGKATPMPRRGRRTAQQHAVLDLLSGDNHFRSAQQLHIDLNQHRGDRIALTTVYRILQTFTRERIVESQRAEDGAILYRLSTDRGHHHNLLCRRCGRAIGFEPHDLEQEAFSFAVEHGFTDITHHIDVYGTCPQCGLT